MISKSLINAVYKEAKKLKAHATAEELNDLDWDSFDPGHDEYCIYGQTTGDCRSRRALELLNLCAPIAIETSSVSDNVSCKLPKGDKADFDSYDVYAWSPIEVYIAQTGADNEHLIDYLKGKTDTLDLSKTINC